jgi:ATP-binding cassette subfamily F protein 3
VTSYAGGYSDFRFERLTRALSEQADYKAKSQHVARLTELVRQFEIRARATGDPKWGKRLKARRTQLEKARAELGEEPELEGRRIELSFGNVESRSDIALEVSGYDRAVGDRVLFQGAELLVTNGERVGLVGPNGSGKTTFLRDVVTTGAWENATIRVGPSMRIGYCAQHRDDRGGGAARPDAGARGSGEPQGSAVGAELATRRERAMSGGTLLDLALSSGAGTRQEAYKTLGRLLFAWGDLDRSVDTLSGGEWNRLQLGLAIIGKANLLVLDEPTNHLDIESREAVEEALRDFAGTILVVSHDRYFLDAVVTRVVELTELRLESHAGSFSEFWRDRRRALHRAASTAGGSAASRATSISARGRSVKSGASAARAGGGANARGAGRTPGDANARIEEAILSLETERDRLEGEISDAFQSGDYRLGRKLSEDLNRVNGRIEEMYEKWGA